MILVDYRDGSKELAEPLKAAGLPVEVVTLDAGDVAFEGRGEGGKAVMVGIEYKKLSELVGSLRTERLQGHQLNKMRDPDSGYDYSWLFIEGELHYDTTGKLLRKGWFHGKPQLKPLPGGMTVGELLRRIYVLHLCGGLNPWWTQTRRDTVTAIEILYRTWTDVDLDKHKSHMGIYDAPTLVPISRFRQCVMKFPHVGVKASLAVEMQFNGSLREACNASVDEWAELQTVDDKGKLRRIGNSYAEQIVQFIETGVE